MLNKKLLLVIVIGIFLVSLLSNTTKYSISNTQNLSNQKNTLKINSLPHYTVNLSLNYQLTVHQDEPVRTGVDGEIMLMLYELAADGVNKTPVVGAEDNLTASIVKDSTILSVHSLTTTLDNPGVYTVPFKPSKTGSYTLHLSGILGMANIDKDIPLENVSSLEDNFIIYMIIPLGLITVGGIAGIVFLKYRKSKNKD